MHFKNNLLNVFATLLSSTRFVARGAGCHPAGPTPSGARCPAAANTLEAEGGKTTPRGPSVEHIRIPHPAPLPAAGRAELGRILLTHTQGKTAVSFWAQSCRYLGRNPRFGKWVGSFLEIAAATGSGLAAQERLASRRFPWRVEQGSWRGWLCSHPSAFAGSDSMSSLILDPIPSAKIQKKGKKIKWIIWGVKNTAFLTCK